jgi:hypothetical protein
MRAASSPGGGPHARVFKYVDAVGLKGYSNCPASTCLVVVAEGEHTRQVLLVAIWKSAFWWAKREEPPARLTELTSGFADHTE